MVRDQGRRWKAADGFAAQTFPKVDGFLRASAKSGASAKKRSVDVLRIPSPKLLERLDHLLYVAMVPVGALFGALVEFFELIDVQLD
jgi:hypothetical protein